MSYKEAFDDFEAARIALATYRQKAQGEASDAAQAARDAVMAQHQPMLDTLTADRDAAEKTLTAARYAAAYDSPLLGKTVLEWRRHWSDKLFHKTGQRGIVQVFNRGDDTREHYEHRKPLPGTLVVRPILKSGKPGKACFRYHNQNWYPEGVDPNKGSV